MQELLRRKMLDCPQLPISRFDAMKYAVPSYSSQEVNRAGKLLVSLENTKQTGGVGWAFNVLDNWRAAHAYPAQSFYVTLKRRATQIQKSALVAQRIKRLPSIISKLLREDDMKLSQMQDIGGCRVVVQKLSHVQRLRDSIESINWRHEKLKPKDYISNPKTSGYRGIHLKYRYKGEGEKACYSGLKVELQLRTELQHQWATAVEAADTFTKQALKSSHGDEGWQRFFALMSSVYAIREKCPLVPGTPETIEHLATEIASLDQKHRIVSVFTGITTILPSVEKIKDAAYYLVTLDPAAMKASVMGFQAKQTQAAHKAYSDAEQSLPHGSDTQIVLVSVSSIAALKRVYPNYFLDTTSFLRDVRTILK